MFILNFSN